MAFPTSFAYLRTTTSRDTPRILQFSLKLDF